MALISFASEFLQENRPDFLNIRFIRESRICDLLTGFTHPTDDPQAFVDLILNGSDEEICRISSHWRPKEPLPEIAEVNLVRNSCPNPTAKSTNR